MTEEREKQAYVFPCGQCTSTADAAREMHWDCLRYAVKAEIPWHWHTMSVAALFGRLQVLKFLHHQGCPCISLALSEAANKGDLNCMRFLREECGCPWDMYTINEAASRARKMDCLVYAISNGCPVHPSAADIAAMNDNIIGLRYLYDNCLAEMPWHETGLDNYEAKNYYSAETKTFLRSVEADWKEASALVNLKPAKR